MLKKAIKHIATLVLMFILPLNTAGVIVYNHICQTSGNVTSSLYAANGCDMEETDMCCPEEMGMHESHEPECCEEESSCDMPEIIPQECCKDEVQYVAIDIPLLKDNKESHEFVKDVRDYRTIDYNEIKKQNNITKICRENYFPDVPPQIVQIYSNLRVSSEDDEDIHLS